MDKDAYYFPHFCNARNDRKLRRVRKELGVEGYGIYFMILEVLREQKDFRYPMDDIDLLADEFRTSDQKVRVVVCNYDLFEVDDNEQFFSPKFIEYLSPYLEKKQRNRINGIKGNLIKYNHATKEQISEMTTEEILHLNDVKRDLVGGRSGGESQGDRNKRKVNKIKAKQTKEEAPPKKPESIEGVIKFFENNQSSKKEAESFYYHFDAQDWQRRNGMPISSWHSLAMKWIRDEKHNKPEWKKDDEKKFDPSKSAYFS